MKCPKCQFENREDAKFCKKCGTNLELTCPSCGHPYKQDSIFCDECGHRLQEVTRAEEPAPKAEGERKQVTILFSDLSGYTAMSEKLDPEDAKDITIRIFGEIAKVIDRYEGFIEKYAGDAVMAIFGVPEAHEDDPLRAIRAAREIHKLVETTSPEIEGKIGQPLSMHTGINTGLVVTGQVDMEKGTHGVAGDTVNLAARLSSRAKSGEILVGQRTYRQSEGYFEFEEQEPTRLKGKAEPVRIYKVLSVKERPVTLHRLSGLRADLIGRKAEMAQIYEALKNLREGKGTIFSVCGDAGTGKSRLIEELKGFLDLDEIQWLEGHAYAYAQNTPYFPLIDLLNKAFHIEEGDPPEKVKSRLESGISHLVERPEDLVPYLGSLYSLSYPEIEDVSPEFWKSMLKDAVQRVLSALAERAPTIFCLEDLHWSDPSFIELLRNMLMHFRQAAIVLCVYRPTFSLLATHQVSVIKQIYKEIQLQDLSASESLDMVHSLLKTEAVPRELKEFVQDRVEGNPFYLEEVINTLIESGILVPDDGAWRVTRQISDLEISSTIQGVITARLDRLEYEAKRVLQEASVIGRSFLFEILKRVTELEDQCERCVMGLERLDLIRTKALQPDIEYVFKHALTQEVVYEGLLKKERREIHERIGRVIEQMFQDRLPEFYETLAFHFKQGQSVFKAVDYLVKSGQKSLRRYGVEEAHQYYKEAYDLVNKEAEKAIEQKELLIHILNDWSLVFYYRGDFKGLEEVLAAHEDQAESLDNKANVAMFYAWYGFSLCSRDKLKDSYQYLCKALSLGEEIGDQRIIGYACTWLTWTCAELGMYDEGIVFGKRAQKISEFLESDHYLYFKSMGGLGFIYYFKGDSKKALQAGKAILNHCQKHPNNRSLVMGYYTQAYGFLADGDFHSAIECCLEAIRISADPFYSMIPKLLMGIGYFQNEQFQEAEEPLQEIVSFSHSFGCEEIGTVAQMFLAILSIAKGRMSEGFEALKEVQELCLKNDRKSIYAISEHIMGKVYFQIVEGTGPASLTTMAKNIGFLVRNVPFASKKAEEHLSKAIEYAERIGAKGILGQAYLDLGLLSKLKKKTNKARECISKSVDLFGQCEAEVYLKQAKEALASLK